MQRRSTNILFADVKGYSSLNDPQLRAFATEVLPRAAEALTGHACHHVNTWGDGLVVAADGIRDIATIALKLRDVFSNFDWENVHLPPLNIRLSIHHGEYYQGEDPFTKGGLVTGRSVIRAARIEPVTKPGMIWVTEAVSVAIRDDQKGSTQQLFATDRIGEVHLAKDAGPEEIFSLRRNTEPALPEQTRDTILEEARKRIAPPSNAVNHAERFEACIGVVTRGDQVLLVRRQRDQSELKWMFPAAKKQPLDNDEYIVVREVRRETGVECTLASRITTLDCHPLTGAKCHFFHLHAVDDREPKNLDIEENAEARYVPIAAVTKFIPEHLTAAVAEFLKGL